MGYIPDATLAAFRGNYNLGVFFRLGLATPVLLSLQANSKPISMPGLDPAGSVYIGAGRLLAIPALETLINGIASTVSFSLQGVDPVMTAEMLDSAPEVLGAPVTVGIAPMDVRWQPAAPIVPFWSGVADFLSQSMPPADKPMANRVQNLTLSAISGDQARQIGNNQTLSDATQQALFSGDTACERVTRYTASYLATWPRFS